MIHCQILVVEFQLFFWFGTILVRWLRSTFSLFNVTFDVYRHWYIQWKIWLKNAFVWVFSIMNYVLSFQGAYSEQVIVPQYTRKTYRSFCINIWKLKRMALQCKVKLFHLTIFNKNTLLHCKIYIFSFILIVWTDCLFVYNKVLNRQKI